MLRLGGTPLTIQNGPDMKLTKKKTYMDDYAVQHCLYAKKTHGNPDMHMHNAHAQGVQ